MVKFLILCVTLIWGLFLLCHFQDPNSPTWHHLRGRSQCGSSRSRFLRFVLSMLDPFGPPRVFEDSSWLGGPSVPPGAWLDVRQVLRLWNCSFWFRCDSRRSIIQMEGWLSWWLHICHNFGWSGILVHLQNEWMSRDTLLPSMHGTGRRGSLCWLFGFK